MLLSTKDTTHIHAAVAVFSIAPRSVFRFPGVAVARILD